MDAHKKCCAYVQCTIEKDGCAQNIVAPMYNVPLIKDGCTQKKLRSKMDVRRQLLRYCTMYEMKNMDEQKVALVYNALNEQDGCKKMLC